MRNSFILSLVSALFVASFVAGNALADDSCAAKQKDIPIATKDATASVWSNLRGNEGSIRYESAQLLQGALKNFSSLQAPDGLCANCGAAKPSLVFSSIPKKFRTDSSDTEKCKALEAQTKTHPFQYRGKVFASQEEFNDWYSDFSQGKGKEGTDLYSKCDGDCSPQYHTSIVPQGEKLLVNSEVVCGPPRDKDDNNYVLTFSYRWQCGSESRF